MVGEDQIYVETQLKPNLNFFKLYITRTPKRNEQDPEKIEKQKKKNEKIFLIPLFSHRSFLVTLAVRLGRVVTFVHNKILWSVVLPPAEVTLQDVLDAVGVALLRIDGRAGHVRHHGVPTAPWVLRVPQRVVLWRRLWEPDVAAVTAKMAALQRLSDVFLDDNSATGGVDEP